MAQWGAHGQARQGQVAARRQGRAAVPVAGPVVPVRQVPVQRAAAGVPAWRVQRQVSGGQRVHSGLPAPRVATAQAARPVGAGRAALLQPQFQSIEHTAGRGVSRRLARVSSGPEGLPQYWHGSVIRLPARPEKGEARQFAGWGQACASATVRIHGVNRILAHSVAADALSQGLLD